MEDINVTKILFLALIVLFLGLITVGLRDKVHKGLVGPSILALVVLTVVSALVYGF